MVVVWMAPVMPHLLESMVSSFSSFRSLIRIVTKSRSGKSQPQPVHRKWKKNTRNTLTRIHDFHGFDFPVLGGATAENDYLQPACLNNVSKEVILMAMNVDVLNRMFKTLPKRCGDRFVRHTFQICVGLGSNLC